jgi:pyruvate formate lyase activating enzyme
MELKIFQKGFNYSQDGDGNRLVYHLQGCNMRCPWCSNPEGIALKGTLCAYADQLIDSVCPKGAVRDKNLNREMCKSCGTMECINNYQNKGLKMSYSTYSVDEICEEVIRSSMLFYDGGGVTLSGGEPTLQMEAITELFKRLKEKGIHTAIETNGTHPKLESLFEYLDLLIIDFKHYDIEKHRQFTGVDNAIIKENFAKAFQQHKNVLVHMPLINGFNASPEDAVEYAKFFSQFNTEKASFEFLAFHEYGKTKWEQCGMEYTVDNGYIKKETLNLFEDEFRKYNLRIIHT